MNDLKERLTAWYNMYIVKGWYRTWSLWLAVLAIFGPAVPDLIQILLDNWDTALTAVPVFSESTKATIRLALLVAIPVVRALKQPNLPPKE